jgi:hypothetical protein
MKIGIGKLRIDGSTTPYVPPGASELLLTFNDISNADLLVGDSSLVSDWNTFFNLPTKGTIFTSVEITGNVVNLKGATSITLKDSLFGGTAYGIYLISIIDTLGCIISAGADAFGILVGSGCANLTTVNLPAITTIGNNCFDTCTSLINLNVPLLSFADYFAFDFCTSLINPSFPSLVIAGDQCFVNDTGLVNPSFPVLTTVGISCFTGCINLNTDLSLLETIGGACLMDVKN